MPIIEDMVGSSAQISLRTAAMATGLAGGLWGIAAALAALDAVPAGVHPFEGRVGDAVGLTVLVCALIGVAGGLLARSRPAWSCTLLFVAGFTGFLVIGAGWLMPGLLLSAGSCAALAAIENPFAEEMARDRERRSGRTQEP